jgi:hypothetical protein
MTTFPLTTADARRILADPGRAAALPHLRALAWDRAARDFGIRVDLQGLIAEAGRIHRATRPFRAATATEAPHA